MKSSLRLKSLMISAACLIFAVIFATSVFTLQKSERVKKEVSLNAKATNTMQEILEAKSNIFQIQQFLTDVSLTGDKDGIIEARTNYDLLVKHINEISQQNPDLVNELEAVKTESRKLLDVGIEMVGAYLNKGKATGDLVMKRQGDGLDETSEALGKKMDLLVERIIKEQDQLEAELNVDSELMKKSSIWLSVLQIVLMIGSFTVLYFRVKPLDVVLTHLTENADRLEEASGTINSTSNSLAAVNLQQSSATQKIAAGLEETRAMVEKTSENSQQLLKNTKVTSHSVEVGKASLGQVLNSIESIEENNIEVVKNVEESNKELSQIISLIGEIENKTKVINDIVFQTKLLSFNASVEAARAGENGKGFAVVAEEVGNLANMSGSAAKEISTILTSAVGQVEGIVENSKRRLDSVVEQSKESISEGLRTARDCGQAFETIVAQVSEVTHLTEDIVTAINEQKKGLQEIGNAINELEKTTTHNSQTAQMTSETSEVLVSQMNGLHNTITAIQKIIDGENSKAA